MGYLLTLIYMFTLNVVAGTALHTVISLAGKLFLGFPVIYTVCRYTLAVAEKAGLDPWLAFVLGALSGLVLGVIYALLERRLSENSFVVLSVASIFASVALVKSWDSVTNGVLGISGVARPAGFDSLGGVVLICSILAVLAASTEWLLLRTSLSRRWRALKEAPHVLDGIAISSKKLSFWTIVIASVVLTFATMPYVWFHQYIDPTRGGINSLLEGISIAILVRQPKVSHVILAAAFVMWAPELLRFLDLPANMMGPIRSILYSILVIVVLLVLQRRTVLSNRQI